MLITDPIIFTEAETIKTQEVINIDNQPETFLKVTPYDMSPMIYLQGTLHKKIPCTPHGTSPMTYLLGILHSKSPSDRIHPILYH